MKKIKAGFTLTEVLITMAIIGTICMFMLPAIKNQQMKRDILLVKKAYNTTSQVVSILTNNSNLYNPNTDFGEDILKDTRNVKYNGNDYGGNTKFRELFRAFVNTKRIAGLSSATDFETSDGILWRIPNTDFTQDLDIIIDITPSKGPNCFYSARNCKKPDRFRIIVKANGEVTIPIVLQEYLHGKDIFENNLDDNDQNEE